MPDTNTATAQNTLPSGVEIYDAIMREIEPDLVTSAIAGLTAKYANETAEEKQERLDRYRSAYETYDEIYADWLKKFKEQVSEFKKNAFATAQARSAEEDAKAMASLEESIDNFA